MLEIHLPFPKNQSTTYCKKTAETGFAISSMPWSEIVNQKVFYRNDGGYMIACSKCEKTRKIEEI